jgi:GMP synthase PP-ATPase subunit
VLAIRILNNIIHKRLAILCAEDKIILEELKAAGLHSDLWQSFAMLFFEKTVGIMVDSRAHKNVIAIRALTGKGDMPTD